MNTKAGVRLAAKANRAALALSDCERWAQALTEQFLSLQPYKEAQTIMLYLAMPKEANLDQLIKLAIEQGKEVYVPLCVDKTTLVPVCLRSIDDVTTGVLKIRIPKEPYETIDPALLDLIVVPGAAFDREGGRMGMGNGYYDRFLQQLKPEQYIGVCWNSQLSQELIPMEPYDVRMNRIVTEVEVIHCQRKV